jgi:malate dehydrogenase (oxaloacetate-decarboxylating)
LARFLRIFVSAKSATNSVWKENNMKANVAELLAKAQKPGEDAMRLHPLYRGKLEVTPSAPFEAATIFRSDTPGVAAPCRDIAAHPERVFSHTNKGNFVAVVSDGTRVLGLGDIGPHAALPVMEGKALLFKYLGGVDRFRSVLRPRTPSKSSRPASGWSPVSAGSTEYPCRSALHSRSTQEMTIPVWHDDQQDRRSAGGSDQFPKMSAEKTEARIALIGVGAANVAVQRADRRGISAGQHDHGRQPRDSSQRQRRSASTGK